MSAIEGPMYISFLQTIHTVVVVQKMYLIAFITFKERVL